MADVCKLLRRRLLLLFAALQGVVKQQQQLAWVASWVPAGALVLCAPQPCIVECCPAACCFADKQQWCA